MGKKKPQKTKALSVAIAEASSTGDETLQQPQPQTPRKRGRPRKIIEKPESHDKKEEQLTSGEAEEAPTETQLKKVKAGDEERQEQHEHQLEHQQLKGEGSSAYMVSTKKEEDQSAKMEGPREPPRSRARRKSKPRKSS